MTVYDSYDTLGLAASLTSPMEPNTTSTRDRETKRAPYLHPRRSEGFRGAIYRSKNTDRVLEDFERRTGECR